MAFFRDFLYYMYEKSAANASKQVLIRRYMFVYAFLERLLPTELVRPILQMSYMPNQILGRRLYHYSILYSFAAYRHRYGLNSYYHGRYVEDII